jgi:hypothetical protein
MIHGPFQYISIDIVKPPRIWLFEAYFLSGLFRIFFNPCVITQIRTLFSEKIPGI